MYAIDGVALDNPAMGWVLRGPSKPLPSFSSGLASVKVPGLDGLTFDPAATLDATLRTLMVQTPRANLPALHALIMYGRVLTLTGTPGMSAEFEFVSSDPQGYGAADEVVDLSFVLRIPGVFWRASTDATTAQDITGLTHTVTTFAGLSAPVQDATLRLRGPFTSARVTDSAGSWVMFPFALAAGRFCRFDSASGQAFEYTSDQWTNPSSTVDRSGVVDFGGPRGLFEITPYMTSDPATRSGRLMVQTVGYASGSRFEVRGRAAHAL